MEREYNDEPDANRFQLDTDVELKTDAHDDHMISINTTLVRGGVYRVVIWCADCRRHLSAHEAIASTIIESE